MKINLLKIFITISFFGYSQTPTVGLLSLDLNVSDGYTLFTPQRNNNVYLINNCGEKINQWTFTETPGATCYLLENGNLLRAGKDNLEIRDWDNNVIWNYATTSNGISQHHDIEPLPNGNILCVVSDIYTLSEIIQEGRNPAITGTTLKLDKIIELEPSGLNNANIVWEWKFIDHLIQDFDNTKSNFGSIINNPNLIDINFNNGETTDYTHVNAIDYNPVLDQILISTRHLSEIYIIDHSTSTIESSGHSGGNYNMGGDILWRWGNSQVYKQGDSTNQKLFLQHDAKWVDQGYLDENKISVFNNGGDGTGNFSSIHLILPEIISNSYTLTNNIFNPQNFDWSWNGSILGITILEGRQSGAHSLPNGNFIICETSSGRISEISKSGTHLWSYKNPTGPIVSSSPTIYSQFSSIPSNANGIFRGEKYPTNYIGFSGKNVIPTGIIENENSESSNCIATLNTNSYHLDEISIINPVNYNMIEFNQRIQLEQLSIFDLNGRQVFQKFNFNGNNIITNLNSGIYILKLSTGYDTLSYKVIVK